MANESDDRQRIKPARPVSIAVVGSVNLDLVARAARLPKPGETITGATLSRYPGGKGANQALAAKRLGAHVKLFAKTGCDETAKEAMALLRSEGVDLSNCVRDPEASTGVALIVVSGGGENQIVVTPGANASFTPDLLKLPSVDGVICQLEIPIETVAKAAQSARFFCLNAAPAHTLPDTILQSTDLLVVNETEAAFFGDALNACQGYVAVTLGHKGARLSLRGKEVAFACSPKVEAVDATGAGDVFTAALTVALLEERPPVEALRWACAAGALAVTGAGAQPSFPVSDEINSLISPR